jgi:ubiquinone/menaquinone biosynthesis C-methylase UbiE
MKTRCKLSSSSPLKIEEETKNVNAYFDRESSYWDEIYRNKDVYSVIHQDRRAIAIKYFEELSLPHEARILDIGCGAGYTTVDIARRGYSVEAVDSVAAMIDLTRQNAHNFGVEKQINANVDDVYDLNFPDNSFDLVIALGVAPWIADLNIALKEIFRVLAPGGHVIMTVDHRYRLNHLLDPAFIPALAGVKERLRRVLEKSGLKKATGIPRPHRHAVTEFNNLLASAGLAIIKHSMIGFGPFSFLKIQIFPGSFEIRLHRFLQRAADRGIPFIRSTGSQYLVLARKD